MANIFSGLIKRWNSVRKILVIVSSVIILFLFTIYLFAQNRITGDTASHLLLAVSPILKIGAPYKNFWDIKPAMWPLTIFLWSSLFGFRILSIRIINLIVGALVVIFCKLIYKKVFPTPIFEIFFLFTLVVVFSPILNTFMLPTEMLGLLLSLGALLALIGFRRDFPKYFLSGFLFFAASQTKEPFTFTILAVFPIFIESLLRDGFLKLLKNVMYFLLGILTCFAGIYIYLASFGSIASYIEVIKYKQVFYPFKFEKFSENFIPGFSSAERTFTEFSMGFSILVILSVLSFYLVNKFKKILDFNLNNSQLTMKPLVVSNPRKITKYAVLFYAIGSFLGFALGRSFGSHYLIQVVVPLYIIYGFIVSYLFNNILFLFEKSKVYFYLALFIFTFSLVVVMPKRQYLKSYWPKAINFDISKNIYGFEKRITELTTKDQCILSVYGWGVSENYLYSMRKPCTKFFLPNIVLQDWQKKEYAKDIEDNPPAVIVYQTSAADLDIKKFESEVINIGKIVKNCYIQDKLENVIFIPKTKDIISLKSCIKANSF